MVEANVGFDHPSDVTAFCEMEPEDTSIWDELMSDPQILSNCRMQKSEAGKARFDPNTPEGAQRLEAYGEQGRSRWRAILQKQLLLLQTEQTNLAVHQMPAQQQPPSSGLRSSSSSPAAAAQQQQPIPANQQPISGLRQHLECEIMWSKQLMDMFEEAAEEVGKLGGLDTRGPRTYNNIHAYMCNNMGHSSSSSITVQTVRRYWLVRNIRERQRWRKKKVK